MHVDKKRFWVENLGGSGLDMSHDTDGSVTIIDNFESIHISEEHLGVIGSYLMKLHEGKPCDEEGLAESIAYNKRVYDTFKGWMK